MSVIAELALILLLFSIELGVFNLTTEIGGRTLNFWLIGIALILAVIGLLGSFIGVARRS